MTGGFEGQRPADGFVQLGGVLRNHMAAHTDQEAVSDIL
jgi:hypothetical protein